ASSGDYAQNASSGDNARNASSGNYARNASSGYYAQNASSGNNARNASSGNYARNASSGYNARNASSGDNARNVSSGRNSVVFDCGFKSVIKAVDGTWISLCEYKRSETGNYIPYFALSAQIGNPEYLDFKGNILSAEEFYILKNKQFVPVILADGIRLIKSSSKIKDGIEIIKCKEFDGDGKVFCVRKGEIFAHGETLKQAISDLLFKEMGNREISEIVENIKRCGYVTREDYRCITGACSFGTEQFAKEHGYENVDRVELSELIVKLDDNYYGAKKFKELFD
ncbi:MAG: hypothetical protein RR590_03410, partial [Hungatella sp.]